MVNDNYVDGDPFVLKGQGAPVESINNFLMMGGLLEGEIDIKVPDQFSTNVWSNLETPQKARFCKFTLQNMTGTNNGSSLAFAVGQSCIIKAEIFIQMLDQIEKLQIEGTGTLGTVNILKNYPVVTADDIIMEDVDLTDPTINLLHADLNKDSFYIELIAETEATTVESITLTIKTKKLDGIGDFGINRSALEGGDLFPLHETDLDSSLQTKVNSGGSGTTVNPYPIGSIYLSVTNTNPATLFGGTWEQLKNKFLLAADDATTGAHAGDTGGEKDHTLSIAEMPIHKHDVDVGTKSAVTTPSGGAGTTDTEPDHSHESYFKADVADGGSLSRSYNVAANGLWTANKPAGAHNHTTPNHAHTVPAHDHSVLESNKGSGNAHNNMPPYLAVYMWKRTA